MLRNSVEEDSRLSVYEQLATKFNIDLKAIKKEQQSECYQLGAGQRYFIFREHSYFLAAITQKKESLSKFDAESVRSGEDVPAFMVEPSDKSTPKFKNSDGRFRKKSHKNSFGGDI